MRSWVLIVACALLLLPAASAQTPGIQKASPAETTMYVHLGVPSDYPINTQQPDDRYGVSQGKGLATMTNTCVPEPVPGIARGDHHTWYAYSSPGYVQYDVDLGGKPRVHPERGLSYDIDFDTNEPIRLKWYVESQFFSADTEANQAAAATPDVVLRATLREGDEISVDHASMNTGRVIGQAQTDPALLAGEATPDHPQVAYVPVEQDGQTKHVYEFSLEVPFADPGRSPQVPADESFNLRVDLFVENQVCNDPAAEQSLMPNTVRLHSSPDHRPRFSWTVLEPLRIEALHPQFIGDDLVVHTSANSPWGNYDLRGDQESEAGGYTLSIEGPSIPVDLGLAYYGAAQGDIINGHDHHTDAVAASYVWPYKAENAQPGQYVVTLRVLNDQESSEAVAVALFELGRGTGDEVCVHGADGGEECYQPQGGETQDSPGAAVGLLASLLGAAVAARRRR